MANIRTLQLLRNATLYENLDAAKTDLSTKVGTLLDGCPVVGRYKVITGSTAEDYEIRAILGIVQEDGGEKTVSFFNNTEEIDNVLDNLYYTGVTSDGSIVLTNVTEVDGIISASSESVGALTLADYVKGSDSGSVTTSDTINSAISKLENRIETSVDSLNYNLPKDDNKVVVHFEQKDGLVSGESSNLTAIKLNGYTEAESAGDIADTDTLGQALGKIQKTVHTMNKSANVENGKVVTTVSEANGVVSETKANVKDLQLGGYQRTDDAGEIAANDTINVAFSKIENKVISAQSATTIHAGDGSIDIDYKASGATIVVNVKDGEKVIKLDNSENGGLYTDISILSATAEELATLGTNVREAYKLVATDGTKLGDFVKIYKDSSLVNFYLGTVGDLLSGTTSQSDESDSSTVIPGTGDTALVYVMQLADGKYKLAAVNVESFLQEAEFASGVTADSTTHVVRGVVDPSSESFLTVGANGFKIAGVEDAINAKVNTLSGTTSGNSSHVSVGVSEANGIITAVTVSENGIATISDLEQLSSNTITSITSTNSSITANVDDSTGNKSYNIETDASKIKMSGFTGTGTILSGITTNDSITNAFTKIGTVISSSEGDVQDLIDGVNEKVEELSANTFTEASSLNGSVNFVESAASDGTTHIDIQTDASLISGLTAVASVIGELSGVSTTDSIKTAINNLYASLKAEIASRKEAISGSVVSGSSSISVDPIAQGGGSVVSVKLDSDTVGNGDETTGGNNALTITNDGLFLSTNWECGTY